MKRTLILLVFIYYQLGLVLFAEQKNTSHAQPMTSNTIPSQNVLIVEVNGLVCSFCAHGLKKTVSKFEWIDTSLNQDGVFVNIEEGTLTITIDRTTSVDLSDLLHQIKKNGYQPHSLSFWISGKSSLINDQLRLKSDAFIHPFIVTNANKLPTSTIPVWVTYIVPEPLPNTIYPMSVTIQSVPIP